MIGQLERRPDTEDFRHYMDDGKVINQDGKTVAERRRIKRKDAPLKPVPPYIELAVILKRSTTYQSINQLQHNTLPVFVSHQLATTITPSHAAHRDHGDATVPLTTLSSVHL